MNEVLKFICGTESPSPEVLTCFYTFLLTIATFLLCLIGWVQLNGLKKISNADFINKFNKDFFNSETQKLILLLSYQALEFRVKEIRNGEDVLVEEYPYFIINKEIIKQFPINNKIKDDLIKEAYSSYEVDDLLLGYFEEIGCFEKGGLIGIKGVYDGFDWYIQLVWNNPEIQKYINYTKSSERNGEDIYENFEYIFVKDQSYGQAKLHRDLILIWRAKWWLSNKILKR